MRYRYIPILRWKRGEQRGLKAVAAPMVKDVCPLIVVNADTFADRPETQRSEFIPASFLFADEVFKHWGSRPFYLDASAIEAPSKGVHPLIDTAKECRKLGAHLIPATTLAASEAYEAAVMNVAQANECGVALTVRLREFTSAQLWAGSWPHALDQTDLIVDLSDKIDVIADLGSALDLAFRNLHRATEWKTVTVAGSSMPENFGNYDTDKQHLIERAEWTLWQHLISLHLPYRLDYGDYATVAVAPPPGKIRWGYPINVRYTLPTQFLICRGVRTTGKGAKELDDQLIAHAKAIAKYKKRSRLDCWADRTIDKIAAEDEDPGGLESWVKIAVNRHIERVRTDIP